MEDLDIYLMNMKNDKIEPPQPANDENKKEASLSNIRLDENGNKIVDVYLVDFHYHNKFVYELINIALQLTNEDTIYFHLDIINSEIFCINGLVNLLENLPCKIKVDIRRTNTYSLFFIKIADEIILNPISSIEAKPVNVFSYGSYNKTINLLNIEQYIINDLYNTLYKRGFLNNEDMEIINQQHDYFKLFYGNDLQNRINKLLANK
jgi:hypothetical protein